jgi:acyl carrier protein
MHQVIDAIRTRFDQLHGVIHAAGVPGGGIIQLKIRGEAERVMAPKVAGALALEEALGDVDLDFVALCSSLASLLGGAGQVDYCAANAFLDAFAHANDGKRRVIAINWDRWQEVGMAVGTQAPADLQRGRETSGWVGIGPVEGVKAFERALRSPAAQVAVATFDFRGFLAAHPVSAVNSADQPSAVQTDQPLYERPALASPYTAPESEIEQTIAGLFEALLGVQPVGTRDNFFELGGHSLLAIQLVSRLRDIFHVELPMQAIFESPTVADLAKTIETIRWAEGRDAASVSGEQQEYEEGEL